MLQNYHRMGSNSSTDNDEEYHAPEPLKGRTSSGKEFTYGLPLAEHPAVIPGILPEAKKGIIVPKHTIIGAGSIISKEFRKVHTVSWMMDKANTQQQ